MILYTSETGSDVIGLEPGTMRHYAKKYGVGFQPGGPGTQWLFTLEDLLSIRNRPRKFAEVEMREDREVLGLGPLYNPDASPRS